MTEKEALRIAKQMRVEKQRRDGDRGAERRKLNPVRENFTHPARQCSSEGCKNRAMPGSNFCYSCESD
jgi:hypothetical protein